MNEVEVVKRYIGAQNDHDPEAAAALFNDEASFKDPGHEGKASEILPDLISDPAKGFPDLSFEVVNLIDSGKNQVILEWVMR